jgi:CRP-like cAMP-binding protein
MTSQDKIIYYIKNIVTVTEDEALQFATSFKEIKIKRRQFIIQPEFVAKCRYFVVHGAVRAYVIDNDGQEHTIQLAIEDWWISDYNSYMFQQPASMFVTALEDCVLLQISFEDEQKLKSIDHKFETFFRIIAERAAAFMQRRIISNLTQSAEERYDLFLEKYPRMAFRFPQYVIASYLGMTTQFLSKIRNQKANGKS